MLLTAIAVAWPHGSSFGALQVSIAPDDPDALWVQTEGWGLAHSTDGGGTWTWHCEEALGAAEVYGVVALSANTAMVATRTGLLTVDDACGHAAVPELDGSFVPFAAPWGGRALVGSIGEGVGGFYACDAGGCGEPLHTVPGAFPKSAVADGDRVWGTTVDEAGLAARLWTSGDGAWTEVATWPDGDTDPRVLHADGDLVLVWRRTRAAEDVPELLRSTDGGQRFASVLQAGYYTDSTPGFLALGDTFLLGSAAGARTWRSDDRGTSWTEVSTEVPAVRCGSGAGGVGFACADHLQDGFDVARTTDGRTWVPVACLEDAVPAECAAETCDALLTSYRAAGAYGGGQCDTIVTPPADPPAEGCGCGDAAAVALLPLALVRRRRHSPSRKYTSPA